MPPGSAVELESLRRNFLNPPDDSRILMRWWWFGPAVTKLELARELGKMKEGGIGGVDCWVLGARGAEKLFRIRSAAGIRDSRRPASHSGGVCRATRRHVFHLEPDRDDGQAARHWRRRVCPRSL